MTVATEVTRVICEGNGVTTSFAYSFPIPGVSATDQTNAELILTDSTGVSTTLASNLWSITGVVSTLPIDGTATGTFIYNPGSPITTGNFLTLSRIVPYEQGTALTGQGAYSPAVVEAALDDLALQTEQLNTWRLQSVRAPITDPALSDLPTVPERKGSFLFFDNFSGDVSTVSSTSGIPSSIYVGTNSTSEVLSTALLVTGSAVTSVTHLSGVATATLTGGSPGGSSGQVQYNNSGAFGGVTAMSGDATQSVPAGVLTLATVNSNVGSFTNASITVNAKGLVTAASTGAGGGGGMTFIAAATANNTATNVTFTNVFTSTYDDYLIVISGLILATNNTDLQFQFAVSGTPNASSNYFYFINWVSNGGSVANPNGTGTLMKLVPGYGTDISQGTDARLAVTQPLSTANLKNINGPIITRLASGTVTVQGTFGGMLNVTGTAFDGFRISSSSGNLVSGSVRVYGLQKS